MSRNLAGKRRPAERQARRRRCGVRRSPGRTCRPGRPPTLRTMALPPRRRGRRPSRHDQDGEGCGSGWRRGRAMNGGPGRGTRLIVGVSRSPASWRALDWAVGEARRRGACLLLVHVFRPPVAPAASDFGSTGPGLPRDPYAERVVHGNAQIRTAIAEAVGTMPGDVATEQQVIPGGPPRNLLASRGAVTCSCSDPGAGDGCAGSRPARWRVPARGARTARSSPCPNRRRRRSRRPWRPGRPAATGSAGCRIAERGRLRDRPPALEPGELRDYRHARSRLTISGRDIGAGPGDLLPCVRGRVTGEITGGDRVPRSQGGCHGRDGIRDRGGV